MKCLFCENPVPLVQTLVQRGSPFCSDSHKSAYHADTERLMLARLKETLKKYNRTRAEEVQLVYETVSLVHVPRDRKMRLRAVTSS